MNITQKVLLAMTWTPQPITEIAEKSGVTVRQVRNAIARLRAQQVGIANTARGMYGLSHFMGRKVKRAA